jgi:hypothetical protein
MTSGLRQILKKYPLIKVKHVFGLTAVDISNMYHNMKGSMIYSILYEELFKANIKYVIMKEIEDPSYDNYFKVLKVSTGKATWTYYITEVSSDVVIKIGRSERMKKLESILQENE